ncbi:MAG: HAD family hydrolase [Ruminococcaceae bacterium]|nr:HAD family hydrolase [Oscillospiraceae bacterium]
MIKLMIFDLDGTVLDTISTIAYYGNLSLEKFGLPKFTNEKYKYFTGEGAKNLTLRMLEDIGAYTPKLHKELYDFYMKSYNADPTYKTTIFPHLKETLKKVKEKGIKIAILSNKPHFATEDVTKKLFGNDFFDLVLGQRENIPLKPDPQAVYEIMDYFNVKDYECIFLGDTSTDIKTGKNANLYTVGVLWGFRNFKELSDSGADVIISKPETIFDIIN